MLVTGPGKETFPSRIILETPQSCHLLSSLAPFSCLAGSALLPTGPLATPTAVPLHLEPGGSVGTAPRGLELNSCVLGFLRKSCSLEALRQARLGWDGAAAWEGLRRVTPHPGQRWNSAENSQPHLTENSWATAQVELGGAGSERQ